jgi:hypothetical protein
VGYLSATDSYQEPWNATPQGGYDGTEQANAYTALMQYWNNESYMGGVFWWWWSTNPSYGGSGNTDYTPQNKPAEQVLEQYWLSPPTPSGSSSGASSGSTTFTLSGTASPSAPSTNQAVTLTGTVTAPDGSASNDIVDMEIYNGSSQTFQQYFPDESFSQNDPQSFTATWTPTEDGTYTLKLGVFNSTWSQDYAWDDTATTITVGDSSGSSGGTSSSGSGSGTTSTSTSSTPTGTYTTDVWWPTNDTHVNGTQPFQAMLENLDTSQYTMYWQVDGGQLNLMNDNATTYPHKEADVDLSGWTWNGDGPYTVTFVSKNADDTVISQSSVEIYIP